MREGDLMERVRVQNQTGGVGVKSKLRGRGAKAMRQGSGAEDLWRKCEYIVKDWWENQAGKGLGTNSEMYCFCSMRTYP